MNFYRSAAVAAVMSVMAFGANAATVTLYGDDVSFTFDDSSLFGDAIVVGNNIFFQPTSFRAESINGQGAVTASETLNITVEVLNPNGGYVITDSVLIEGGDYFLSSGDTSVTASARLQVTSQTTNCPSAIPGFDLPCTDSEIVNIGGLDTVGATTEWQGGTTVNLADTAGWGSDTLITAQIQNNLSATTLNDGEQAWIEKKYGAVGMSITVIPVPAAVWLFGSALAGLGWMRRRPA